jgi:hypothetical protein
MISPVRWLPVALSAVVALAVSCAGSESKNERECGDAKCDSTESPDTCPADCTENVSACAHGQVATACTCGTTSVNSGYCCGGVAQTSACSTAPASCSNGQVTASCVCGTKSVSSGYCCSGVAQTSACSTAPASCSNGQVTASCMCGTKSVSSGYCCSGVAQTSACSSSTSPTSCPHGQVTASCICGTKAVTSEYCCGGVAQTSACSYPAAGNPDGKCSKALPAQAQAVDTSKPTTVIGTGTPQSCTYAQLASAVSNAGIITFNCGSDPVTIPVTATLALKTDRDTVIDGGNRVTLDGGGSVQIFNWNYENWQSNTKALILQHLVLANAKVTPTAAIPSHPAPCSQGYFDGMGGAIYMRDGILRAFDVSFINNTAGLLGPDNGGGAIYIEGSFGAYISSCTFQGNRGSNAGGIGGLYADLYIYNSLFDANQAVGYGANIDDSALCSYQIEPPWDTDPSDLQYEVGSGGNGGAIYKDGAGNITVCGTQIRNNYAKAFGVAIFDTGSGTLSVTDSLLFENKQCYDWWQEEYQGVRSTGISWGVDDCSLTADSITPPKNWSANTDSVCGPLIEDYCTNLYPEHCS